MRFVVLTLFPELFGSFVSTGLVEKAIAGGLLEIERVNPRDYTTDKHRSVDDTPYGGGSGMVLMPGPIAEALDARAPRGKTRRVLLTPQGAPFTQKDARRLADETEIALVCGRYEGYDERIRSLCDEEISLGDFVLLGGEVAAMAIIEATSRLAKGVIGNEDSTREESHEAGVLEYPQYTRPLEFRGETVPDVLRGGNHAAIAAWRRTQALVRTRERRPDLFAKLELDLADRKLLAAHDAGAK